VGRLPAGDEYFGLLFQDGNPLVDCVNKALATLHENGSIDQFQQEWIETSAPPVLQ
jgi:polar amino acid transport system substrate-binding protein